MTGGWTTLQFNQLIRKFDVVHTWVKAFRCFVLNMPWINICQNGVTCPMNRYVGWAPLWQMSSIACETFWLARKVTSWANRLPFRIKLFEFLPLIRNQLSYHKSTLFRQSTLLLYLLTPQTVHVELELLLRLLKWHHIISWHHLCINHWMNCRYECSPIMTVLAKMDDVHAMTCNG